MVTDVKIESGNLLEVVSLERAKKHLRLEAEFTDEDELILAYIDSSIEECEKFIGGHIQDKNMIIKATAFENPLVFEAFPVKAITSIKYFAENIEEEKTLNSSEYKLTSETDKRFQIRFLNELPVLQNRYDAVTFTINIGMNDIPKPISQAVLLLVADKYEFREDRPEKITTVANKLLRPYKKY